MKNPTAMEVLAALQHAMKSHSVPTIVCMDHGSSYKVPKDPLKALLKKFEVKTR